MMAYSILTWSELRTADCLYQSRLHIENNKNIFYNNEPLTIKEIVEKHNLNNLYSDNYHVIIYGVNNEI